MRLGLYIKGFVCLALLLLVYSCSIRSNYKTLSTFFDGVPNPYIADSIARADSINELRADDTQTVVVVKLESTFHPPYVEKECAACHNQNSMGKLTEAMPALCYQCHEDFNELYNVLHGPVDAGFCTECHNPHMSKNENLLIRTGRDLCFYCHNSDVLLKGEVHSEIEEMNCTECHNPHGGEDRFIFNQ